MGYHEVSEALLHGPGTLHRIPESLRGLQGVSPTKNVSEMPETACNALKRLLKPLLNRLQNLLNVFLTPIMLLTCLSKSP